MRHLACLIALVPAPALAHPCHLGALAGHDHWVAGAAIGIAIGAAIWGALKGRGLQTEPSEPDESATEEQSA